MSISSDKNSFEFFNNVIQKVLYPVDEKGAPKTPVGLALAVATLLGLIIVGYKSYAHLYSFTVGLDYFEPEFQAYWMSWFWAQIIIIPAIGIIGAPLIWFTRDKNVLENTTPAQELGQFQLVFVLIAAVSFFAVCAMSLFAEADAAWHQVTIRDTDFTPTHIQLFYGLIPAGAMGIILGAIWIHTRMPHFVNRVSIPFVIVASAPILMMPNLGYNEWGHTFFYAEELFAAPIHYGFVLMGWGMFGLSGFIIQCLQRVNVLTQIKSSKTA